MSKGLIDSDDQTARKYWKVLKGRLKEEGCNLFTNQQNNELATNCYQVKMPAADEKHYKTDVADTEQVLRLVQSKDRVFR